MIKKSQGFTLIELVVVIVILGILAATAAPKFIDLTEDADKAVFSGIAAAFKGGVKQVHVAWLIRGNNQAVQDFIELPGDDLSVNSFGYPADTRGRSLELDSANDCLDVWRAVLDTQDADVENNADSDFQAEYDDNYGCNYTYVKQPTMSVYYNSRTGEITVSGNS